MGIDPANKHTVLFNKPETCDDGRHLEVKFRHSVNTWSRFARAGDDSTEAITLRQVLSALRPKTYPMNSRWSLEFNSDSRSGDPATPSK